MHSNSFTVASRPAPMPAVLLHGPRRAGLGLHMPMPEPTPPSPPVPPRPQDIEPIEDPPEDGAAPTAPVQDPPVAPNSDVPERLARAVPAPPHPHRTRPAASSDARIPLQYRCPPRRSRTPA